MSSVISVNKTKSISRDIKLKDEKPKDNNKHTERPWYFNNQWDSGESDAQQWTKNDEIQAIFENSLIWEFLNLWI